MTGLHSLPILGILAGGRGVRMGMVDKAGLPSPSGDQQTLLGRIVSLGESLGLACVVVGGPAREGLHVVADAPQGLGPIGGLCALLAYAAPAPVIALACDMPFVSAALIERLALTQCGAPVCAARDTATGKWQPWFARYDAPRVLPQLHASVAAGERSLQRFFAMIEVEQFALAAGEEALLRDWDSPEDMAASR